MKRPASLLLLILAAGTALAQMAPTSPEESVPQRPYLEGLNADQRAAWFLLNRALLAERERDELRSQLDELRRKMIANRDRLACTS